MMPPFFYTKELLIMKRVIIETPGKVLDYGDFTGIRTPTFIDIEDDEIESIKKILTTSGIDKYKIEDDFKQLKRKSKKSLKRVRLIGATNKKIKLSLS